MNYCNYTTYEQSKRLVELGLNIETADAWYKEVYEGQRSEDGQFLHYKEKPTYIVRTLYKDWESNCSEDMWKYVPCWNVGLLLELLPKTVTNNLIENDVNTLFIYPNFENDWIVGYGHIFACGELASHCFIKSSSNFSLIDSVFEFACWLLENNYLDNENLWHKRQTAKNR